jgi:hypothetical protein
MKRVPEAPAANIATAGAGMPEPPPCAALPQIIDLDVGGRHFSTMAATLSASPTLAAMLAPGATQLFVDRDPDAFVHVLAHLRGVQLPTLLGTSVRREIAEEALFFQLPRLAAEAGGATTRHESDDSSSEASGWQATRDEIELYEDALREALGVSRRPPSPDPVEGALRRLRYDDSDIEGALTPVIDALLEEEASVVTMLTIQSLRDWRAGDTEAALRHCRQGLREDPANLRLLRLMAALGRRACDIDAALEADARLGGVDPWAVEGWRAASELHALKAHQAVERGDSAAAMAAIASARDVYRRYIDATLNHSPDLERVLDTLTRRCA